LAAAEPPAEAMRGLTSIGRSKRRAGRSYRGLNPLLADDLSLLAAIFRGEHALDGFRNEDIRRRLFGEVKVGQVRRHQANKTRRLLRRLHVHGLLAKIPRSGRWRVTQRGHILVTTMIQCHYHKYPEILAQLAT